MNQTAKHRTVKVRVEDWEADIDADIAPLIEEIWKADIFTVNSCQENQPGIAWIQFLSPRCATRFLGIVAHNDGGIGSLMRLGWERVGETLSAPFWEYNTYPLDFTVLVSIRFPRSDIPVLLNRLRNHNNAKRGLVESQS